MTPEEKDRRAARREERAARTRALAPRMFERKRESTDVDKVKDAHEKRERRNLRRMEEAQRRREGQR